MKSDKHFEKIDEALFDFVQDFGFDISFMITIVDAKNNRVVNTIYGDDNGKAKIVYALSESNDNSGMVDEMINVAANVILQKIKQNSEFKKSFLKEINEQSKNVN
jgi:uncharacterized membrane protein YvbJ